MNSFSQDPDAPPALLARNPQVDQADVPQVSVDLPLLPNSDSKSARLESSDQPTSRTKAAFLRLAGYAAQGWFLSLMIHIMSYLTGMWMFYRLGMHLVELDSNEHFQIAASLSDESVVDDSAKLEIVQDISSGNTQNISSLEQLARHLNTTSQANEATLDTDVLQSFTPAEDGKVEGGAGDGFLFKMPESGLAVTKGSFTAWTVPLNPAPRQNYLIIIEIQLPSNVARYQLTDLNGSSIRGSDQYQQRIPFDADASKKGYGTTASGKPPLLKLSDALPVVENKVQLVVKVPGARRLVMDTIKIKSRRLREEQELNIVFGKSPVNSDSDTMPSSDEPPKP